MSQAALLEARASAQRTVDMLDALLAAGGAPQAVPAPAAPLSTLPTPTPVLAGLQRPQAFFDTMRAAAILGPVITEGEAGGCVAILGACAGQFPASWAAYTMATAYHETAGTMQPIKEYGGEAYFRKMYDIEGDRPAKARELGNLSPGDGVKYCGRGYVQLTGKANYAKAQAIVGQPLVEQPDLAMRADVAALIMADGMKAGWFTGKSLRTYIPAAPTREHFANARRVINGTDKADQIAGYAMTFLAALQAGDWK